MDKPIVFLTKAQRTAVEAALVDWTWNTPSQRRMGLMLQDSGLLHMKSHRSEHWGTTVAGRMALRGKTNGHVWWPQDPSLTTCHSVRKLKACSICKRLCIGQPVLNGEHGHMTCFVLHYGWDALVEAPDEEVAKMNLQDLLHLGLCLNDFVLMREDVKKAMRKEPGYFMRYL